MNKIGFKFNAELLSKLIIKKSLSLARIEEGADLTNTTIHRLRSGKYKNPSMETVAKIARYFEMPIEDFLIER